jgi:hypothetical protein
MSLSNFTKNGVTYFQLFISCPVCQDKGVNTEHSFWTHYDNDCGGDVYLGENAFYLCKKCGKSAHAMKWRYGCPQHSNMDDELSFYSATPAALASVVSCAGMLVTETGISWLTEFLKNLEN